MLLPTNVMARPWYQELYPEGSPGAPVFVAPHQRYTFGTKDARNADGAIATPLATMWFVGGKNNSEHANNNNNTTNTNKNTG